MDKLDQYILGTDAAATRSETFLRHALKPENAGSLENANGFASLPSHDGGSMEIWLRVEGGIIRHASFWTDGCGTTIACCSMAAEIAINLTAGQALNLDAGDIEKGLDGLPGNGCTCARLAADTLKAAVRDYLRFQNEPWRRKYGK